VDDAKDERRELRDEIRGLRREIGELHLTIIRVSGALICVLLLGTIGLMAIQL